MYDPSPAAASALDLSVKKIKENLVPFSASSPAPMPGAVPLPDAVASAALSSPEDWLAYLTPQVMYDYLRLPNPPGAGP
jgi:hypothetical protein